jgi:predicted NUDIX family phosphoesterase
MAIDEEVLVVPASLLETLGVFSGFQKNVEPYLSELLKTERMAFQARSQCETDPSFKQLIPYCVLVHTDASGNVSVFQYTRGTGQGEQRLHAKRSIGIGGHISREDAAGSSDPYRTGMRRELTEEIDLSSGYKEELVGLIYDDTTEVGRVHLGIVHRFELEQPLAHAREHDLVEAGFVPLDQIRENYERLETWSQLCIDHLFGK